MALAEQSQLVVTIRLNDQMSPTAVKVGKQMQDIERKTVSLRKSVARVGEGLKTGLANSAKIAAVGVGFLAYNIKQGADAIARYQSVTAQTGAVLKSTRHAAGLTAKDVARLSENLEKLTGIEAETNQEAANVLLTFTNISKKVFPDTLAIVADISTAMGTDMKQQSVQLGKALNDPIRGMSALTDVGVTFSDQQRKMITRLQESGRTVKAQKIILAELRKEFGGSAVAADKTFGGSLRRLRNATTDLQSALAAPLIEPIGRLARRLSQFAKNPEVIQGVRDLGTAIAGMFSEENIDAGFEAMKNGIQFLKDLDWSQVSQAVSTSAEIMKTTVGMFMGLPAPLKGALISFLAINKLTGGLGTAAIKGIGELLLSNLKTITAANVTVIGANVTGAPGTGTPAVPLGPAAPSAATKGLRTGIVLGAGLIAAQLITDAITPSAPSSGNYVTDYVKNPADKVEGAAGNFTNYDNYQIRSLMATMDAEKLVKAIFGDRRTGTGFVNPFRGRGLTRGLFGSDRPGPPGPATVGPNSLGMANQFIGLANKLYLQGKLSGERFTDIANSVADGTKTYKQAVKELQQIKGAQGEVKTAIQGQKYQFLLKPSVTISASATGKAITFAANGQRLEIL